ncbi:hypothetical protein D9M69_654470 [compost metagenome]
MPDPVLLVGLGQRVEVEHGFPVGLGLAVFGQRGAPPQALGVLLVAPEVVEERADLAHHRNAGLGVEHFEDALLHPLEGGRPRVALHGLRVVLARPFELFGAVDVFEPLVLVGLRGSGGCHGRSVRIRHEERHACRQGRPKLLNS